MALAPSGAALAGLLAAALAACSGAAGDPVSAPGSHLGSLDPGTDELLLREGVRDWLIPDDSGLRVSLAKFTWTEEVAAGMEAGDTPLLQTRGLKTEAENVDGY